MLRPACGGSKLGALSNQHFASDQIFGQAYQYNKSIEEIQDNDKRRNPILILQKYCQEKNGV
jgi:hypothetical protein